jgi:hypothetical protein
MTRTNASRLNLGKIPFPSSTGHDAGTDRKQNRPRRARHHAPYACDYAGVRSFNSATQDYDFGAVSTYDTSEGYALHKSGSGASHRFDTSSISTPLAYTEGGVYTFDTTCHRPQEGYSFQIKPVDECNDGCHTCTYGGATSTATRTFGNSSSGAQAQFTVETTVGGNPTGSGTSLKETAAAVADVAHAVTAHGLDAATHALIKSGLFYQIFGFDLTNEL